MLSFTTSTSISIIDVFNVTLTGASDHQSSVIHCVSEFSVIAMNVQNLNISNLSFSGCGTSIPEGMIAGDRSSVPRSTTLFLAHVSNVSIVHTHMHNSKGTGVLAINAFDLILYRTSFVGNKPNCVVIFEDKNNPLDKLHVTTYIADSQFAYGRSDSWYIGGGLSFTFFQTLYTVHVNIINVTLYNNVGTYGNFLMIIKGSCRYTMVRVEKVRSSNGLRHTKSGFTLIDTSDNSVSVHQRNHSLQSEYTVHVLESYFYASVDTIAIDISSAYHILRVKFTDITLYNKRNAGFGMFISNVDSMVLERINVTNITSPIVVMDSEITIHNAFIVENEGIHGVLTSWKSVVTFLGENVFIRNYPHEENEPGAVYAYSSTLIFLGNVDFVDNKGYNGGALALYAGSEIVIGKYACLKFCGNHAKHLGGAVYVDNHMLFNLVTISCFYKLAGSFSSRMKWHVVFENNTAGYAGSALFGGWVDFCEIESDNPERPVKPDFNSTFHVNGGESHLSVIASNPLRVCLCIDSKPECSITQYNISAYPGTTIQIPAVAVGQRFGTVPSTVHSDIVHQLIDGIHPNTKDWQHTQRVEKYCTNLTYTIMSPSQVELTIIVKAEKLDTPDRGILRAAAERNFEDKLSVIDPDFYFSNLLIGIETLQCPLGFEYQNTSMICTCDSKLVKYGIKNCSIDAQTIWRKNSFWIATAEGSGGVIVHEHCPFDYCKPDSFDLDLEYPDEQCAFHRSGILCGACQYNLSHVFGTSTCSECSSLWALLWVPVIALAGIVLVVLLIVLNLTVSVGTINGLIFYANIVRANHATFFPANTTNSFLSWFIAWINLDLGIETCFYNGLDAYVKTWLQFIFPLYIWFLVITIIVLSHYYTLAARLSGRNAVQVLATLLLLSYTRLLRIIITVVQSTELHFPYNSVRKVWLYDGNVDYLKGKHIPLFVGALLLLLISLPYTLILIFIQYLQHRSSHRVLFWVQKLKPLFDAYTGPYKDRHRYWTGILLLVRILLILIFALNTRGSPDINVLAISLTVLSLFMHAILAGNVYKTWHLNVIEYSFFLNLGVLASATFYAMVTRQGQLAVTYTSVGIAFALFIIIVVFHIITKLNSCNRTFVNFLRKVKVKLSKLISTPKKLFCKQKRPHYNTQSRVTHATVELHESLLEYCSQ